MCFGTFDDFDGANTRANLMPTFAYGIRTNIFLSYLGAKCACDFFKSDVPKFPCLMLSVKGLVGHIVECSDMQSVAHSLTDCSKRIAV